MRFLAVALVLVLVGGNAACGKASVHEQALLDEKPWDEASPANGFQAVVPEACTKIDAAGQIQNAQTGSLDDVTRIAEASVVATDEQAVYWAEGLLLRRAERGRSPWPRPWTIRLDVTSELPIKDIAVTDGHVYWVGSDGKETKIFYVDKKEPRFVHELVPKIAGPMSRLIARRKSLFYVLHDSTYEVADNGERWLVPAAPGATTFAVDDQVIYTHSKDGYVSMMPRRKPWRRPTTLAYSPDVVDMVSDGTVLYVLERGPETPARLADKDCEENCTTGYQPIGKTASAHEKGKLRRVPVAGGVASDLYVGLPNVESLTMHKGVLWISTASGLLRYDPTCHLPPARVGAPAHLHGRAVPFGEALAVVATRPEPRVALLASP